MDIEIKLVDGYEPYERVELSQNEGEMIFIDRRRHSDTLVTVLAGYKSFAYEDVFDRLKRFAPNDIDICVISSGLYDNKLDEISKNNNWSYLYSVRNCLTLTQNMAITLHPRAEWLYKMDEDIFVTKHCFETLLNTYTRIKKSDFYNISFVAPLIPINGYGHVRILQKLGMVGIYERLFEKVKYAAVSRRMIGASPEVAKFLWGDGDIIPSIDYMDEEFHGQDFAYRPCPVRFSIGFMLMHRDMWNLLGGWKVPAQGNGMGLDEIQINQFSVTESYAMIISENTVVGHLSFGQQNEAMKDYYLTNRDKFKAPES